MIVLLLILVQHYYCWIVISFQDFFSFIYSILFYLLLPEKYLIQMLQGFFELIFYQRLVPFKNLDHPYGLVLHNAELYWTETMKGQIVQWNFTTNSTVVLRNDSKYLFDMVLVTTPVDVSDGMFHSGSDCFMYW